MTFAATLPGPVFTVNSVQVTRAMTVEGASLLSPMRPSSALSLPRQEQGWTNVSFDVHLAAPAADSKGIAEVSGVLECGSAENERIVDLVSGALRSGAQGTEFGAQIDEIRPHVAGGEKLVLRTRLAPEQIRSLKVVGDAGQTVSLEKRGSMAVGEERTYTYISTRPIPRSGRLVAEVMVGSQTVRFPFSVTNLTLLGQPLAAR